MCCVFVQIYATDIFFFNSEMITAQHNILKRTLKQDKTEIEHNFLLYIIFEQYINRIIEITTNKEMFFNH